MPTTLAFAVTVISVTGAYAIHRRLSAEFDRAVVWLTLGLSVVATPLIEAIARASDWVESVTFVACAWLMLALAHVTGAKARMAVAAATVILPAAFGDASGDPLTALFSSSQGLFSLTPVVYIAFLGSLAYARLQPWSGVTAIAAVVSWAVLGAPLLPAVAVLAPGLALVVAWLRARPLLAAAPLVVFALLWNYWLMVQYTAGSVPKDAPMDYATMVRQQADVHTRDPYVFPFALPASAYFAWREGVPIDRYDVLSQVPVEPTFDLPMDRDAGRFLLEGWDAPGSDPGGPVWWIGERRASLLFPIELTSAGLVVSVTARARVIGAPVNADLGVEINGHAVGRFVAAANVPTTGEFTVPAASVGRMLRAGYNRLTIVSHGIDRADSTDSQPPDTRPRQGAWPVAIYRVRLTPAP